MTSLFGDLYSGGIGKPDAVFDQSSMLPPLDTSSYGAAFGGVPDSRINAGTTLFSDMEPYAYGKGDRISTQTAYLANPHNIQKLVPPISLPDSNQNTQPTWFMLPHSVSDGDVAFSIRFDTMQARQAFLPGFHDYSRQGAGKAVDYICNIATVNYIMRGLFTDENLVNPAWRNFAEALGFKEAYTDIQSTIKQSKGMTHSDATKKHIRGRMLCMGENIVRDCFRPIGVVIGSAKQGGRHETSNSACTAPVAYIVTISIDGRNENLCNYWRNMNLSSGSDLGFVVQTKARSSYALNYSKQATTKLFPTQIIDGCPQLCPAINGKTSEPTPKGHHDKPIREHEISGHWHFAMSQVMQQKITDDERFNDVTSFHVGALIQCTISAVWIRKRCPDKSYCLRGYIIDKSEDPKMKTFSTRFGSAGVVYGTAFTPGPSLVAKPISGNPAMNPRLGQLNSRISLVKPSAYSRDGAPAIPSINPDAYRGTTTMMSDEQLIARGIRPYMSMKMQDELSMARGVPPHKPQKVQRLSVEHTDPLSNDGPRPSIPGQVSTARTMELDTTGVAGVDKPMEPKKPAPKVVRKGTTAKPPSVMTEL